MKKIALIGRPNVGKSTLFNRLVGRRAAVVEDQPGVTRDRHFGRFSHDRRTFVLIDTGGLFPDNSIVLKEETRTQTLKALEEADAVVVLFDGRSGLLPEDQELARLIRPVKKPVFFAVNKIEGGAKLYDHVEFYRLGIEKLFPVSAEEGTGLDDLFDAVAQALPADPDEDAPRAEFHARVAVIGRPNAGKSTFINALLGEERLVTSPVPGTTRDAVDTEVEFLEKRYLFVDTAGIRRRGKIEKGVERASVIRTRQAVKNSDVVLIMVDASEGITEQDIKLLGNVVEEGKGFALLINKWDLRKGEEGARKKMESELSRYFAFAHDFPQFYLSATEGFSKEKVYKMIDDIMASYVRRITTGDLNRFLEKTLEKFPPPLYRKKPVKILYATQGGTRPPHFVFFSNFKDGVTGSYTKYLENSLRERFEFKGTPIRITVRQKKNIFKKEDR